MVDGLLILGFVGLTSTGAYLFGLKVARLSHHQLLYGVSKTLEGLGMSLGFFAINLIVGVAIILCVRHFTGFFLSVYKVTDLSLLVLSCFQGLLFQRWRDLKSDKLHKPDS
jgi:hypothetical protein